MDQKEHSKSEDNSLIFHHHFFYFGGTNDGRIRQVYQIVYQVIK